MTNRIDFTHIDRYLSGEATAAEAADMAERAAADPELRALLGALRAPDAAPHTWDVDAAWQRLGRARTARRPATRYLVAAAAAVLLVAGSVVTVWRNLPDSTLASQEYRAPVGAALTIPLPDGSRVTLAARSVLRVPATYGRSSRDVQLVDGEAFFEVEPDSARPFTAHAQGATTRVLGTSFNVAAYAEDAAVEVAVLTGRVLLISEQGADSAQLTAGQVGRTARGGTVAVSNSADVAAHTEWTEGRLTFRDVSFADVARRLERWYDVEIIINDADLAVARVSARFERQTLTDVLVVLATTLDAGYRQEGRRVVFQTRR